MSDDLIMLVYGLACGGIPLSPDEVFSNFFPLLLNEIAVNFYFWLWEHCYELDPLPAFSSAKLRGMSLVRLNYQVWYLGTAVEWVWNSLPYKHQLIRKLEMEQEDSY